MPIILSLLFGYLPMLLYAGFIYWLDRYEKEPRILLGAVFIWGAVFAAGAAYFINTIFGIGVFLITGSETATEISTGSIIAPVVEESIKGLAVLAIFLTFKHEFDSYLDGVIYAAVTALGFAATENTIYIYERGYLESGYAGLLWLVFIRVILVGWQHPFYTAFIGIGFAVTRLSTNTFLKIAAPISGLFVAVITHSIHNTIAGVINGISGLIMGTIVDWSGWLFMLFFIIWAIYREKNMMKMMLIDEIDKGTFSFSHYKTACSSRSQFMARLQSTMVGKFKVTNHFYQACAELAHKKFQYEKIGHEKGNEKIIVILRNTLRELSPHAITM